MALPLTHTTTIYRPSKMPAQRWTWNMALRVHVLFGLRKKDM